MCTEMQLTIRQRQIWHIFLGGIRTQMTQMLLMISDSNFTQSPQRRTQSAARATCYFCYFATFAVKLNSQIAQAHAHRYQPSPSFYKFIYRGAGEKQGSKHF